jgi:hypothetical protein
VPVEIHAVELLQLGLVLMQYAYELAPVLEAQLNTVGYERGLVDLLSGLVFQKGLGNATVLALIFGFTAACTGCFCTIKLPTTNANITPT